ncbi:MAG: hypothetical protein H7831_00090 [Magnetococcus sp. WYHC-3]
MPETTETTPSHTDAQDPTPCPDQKIPASDDNLFYRMGISMAGAVSAGAYTAGVMDFILMALDEWEKARGQDGIPQHRVVITALSGASAGGITAALTTLSLADPGNKGGSRDYPQVGRVTWTLGRLFEGWVVRPRLEHGRPHGGGDALPGLLGNDDFDAPGPVKSLLDSTVLDKILKTSMTGILPNTPTRPYLPHTLPIYLTVSNINGMPYQVTFQGTDAHCMMTHGDRLHFRVVGLGTAVVTSAWEKPDPAVALPIKDLAVKAPSQDWKNFGQAALATAAFPVGLAARIIDWPVAGDYQNRQWTLRGTAGQPLSLQPALPPGTPAKTKLPYVALDGGVINNEPFELVRYTLMQNPPDPNPRGAACADRSVVMIDPFPDCQPRGTSQDDSLLGVIKALLPMLKDQARFKPEELIAAMDEDVFSRFMVAPTRRDMNGTPVPYPLACGSLGGFGGFMDEEFRAHDYELGRRNAQQFLREHFALRADLLPRVLECGYLDHVTRKRYLFNDGKGDFLPIIPLVGKAAIPIKSPKWPKLPGGTGTAIATPPPREGGEYGPGSQQPPNTPPDECTDPRVSRMVEAFLDRMDQVVEAALDITHLSAPNQFLANHGLWKLLVRGGFKDLLEQKICEELRDRGQL